LKRFLLVLSALMSFAYAKEPVNITADKMERDKNGIITASGNVEIQYIDKILQSDEVIYDTENKKIYINKPVYIKTKNFQLKGTNGWWDIENDTGEIYNFEGVVDNKYYTRGKVLRKEKDEYYFKNGEFSSCKFSQYDWYVKAKSGVIKENDEAKTYHTTFNFCKIPIIYTPYFSYPTVDRKTGFLIPTIGQDTYNPFIAKIPFFYVINRSSDLTFTYDYRNKQGEGLDTEYRRVLENGYINADLYFFRESGKRDWWNNRSITPITNRYRLKLDSIYSFNNLKWYLKIDKPSDTYFFEDIYNSSHLKYLSYTRSYLFTNYSTENFDIEFNFDYIYDLTVPNQEQTLQKLPEVRLYYKERKLFDTPFYIDFLSTNINFYREKGESAFRSDNILRLTNTTVFGSLINSFEISPRTTFYLGVRNSDKSDSSRNLFSVKDSVKTIFTRDYSKFIHSIIPEITFTYISKVNQNNLPQFDREDNIFSQKDLDIALNNILTFDDNNFFRWQIASGYTFLDKYLVGLNEYKGNIKPLKNSIFFNIGKYSANNTTYYDINKNNFLRSITSVSFPIGSYINYSISHSYDKADTQGIGTNQIANSMSINYKNYTFNGYILNNLKYGYIQQKRFSFIWDRKCWSLMASFYEDYNRDTGKTYKTIYVMINILNAHYLLPFAR